MEPTNQRLTSLDAFRGFIMLLMASGGFGIPQMAAAHPGTIWEQLAPSFSHREWAGCGLWDLIQPSFMFMVGLAVPWSYAKRRDNGQGFFGMSWHALTRSILLILLAVILTTRMKDTQTTFLFTNVLAQIGLGYFFLFIIWRMGRDYEVAAIIVILVGYWFYFYNFPLPGPGTDFAAIGANQSDLLSGYFGHWSKNMNAASDFDRWFLNLLPRAEPWLSNPGGYQTLNFIPSLATMLAGSLTGRFLRTSRRTPEGKVGVLVIAAVSCLILGNIAHLTACPVVKRIWTPSWALYSTGWVLIMLAAFYLIVEVWNFRRLVFPLVVVGMNSIFIYLLHSLSAPWIRSMVKIHSGPNCPIFSQDSYWLPVAESCGVLFVLWLLCFWMYRQKAFIRL